MNLQVYAEKTIIEAEDVQSFNVYLQAVDGSEVLGQFSAKEKLESIDKSDILDYLHQLKLEEE